MTMESVSSIRLETRRVFSGVVHTHVFIEGIEVHGVEEVGVKGQADGRKVISLKLVDEQVKFYVTNSLAHLGPEDLANEDLMRSMDT